MLCPSSIRQRGVLYIYICTYNIHVCTHTYIILYRCAGHSGHAHVTGAIRTRIHPTFMCGCSSYGGVFFCIPIFVLFFFFIFCVLFGRFFVLFFRWRTVKGRYRKGGLVSIVPLTERGFWFSRGRPRRRDRPARENSRWPQVRRTLLGICRAFGTTDGKHMATEQNIRYDLSSSGPGMAMQFYGIRVFLSAPRTKLKTIWVPSVGSCR